jgi:hypothetical protein
LVFVVRSSAKPTEFLLWRTRFEVHVVTLELMHTKNLDPKVKLVPSFPTQYAQKHKDMLAQSAKAYIIL